MKIDLEVTTKEMYVPSKYSERRKTSGKSTSTYREKGLESMASLGSFCQQSYHEVLYGMSPETLRDDDVEGHYQGTGLHSYELPRKFFSYQREI